MREEKAINMTQKDNEEQSYHVVKGNTGKGKGQSHGDRREKQPKAKFPDFGFCPGKFDNPVKIHSKRDINEGCYRAHLDEKPLGSACGITSF